MNGIYKPPRSSIISLLAFHLSIASILKPDPSQKKINSQVHSWNLLLLTSFLLRFNRSTQPHPFQPSLPPAKLVAMTSFTTFLTLALGLLFVGSTMAAPAPLGTFEHTSLHQSRRQHKLPLIPYYLTSSPLPRSYNLFLAPSSISSPFLAPLLFLIGLSHVSKTWAKMIKLTNKTSTLFVLCI